MRTKPCGQRRVGRHDPASYRYADNPGITPRSCASIVASRPLRRAIGCATGHAPPTSARQVRPLPQCLAAPSVTRFCRQGTGDSVSMKTARRVKRPGPLPLDLVVDIARGFPAPLPYSL
jgi:hypothetical protein